MENSSQASSKNAIKYINSPTPTAVILNRLRCIQPSISWAFIFYINPFPLPSKKKLKDILTIIRIEYQ